MREAWRLLWRCAKPPSLTLSHSIIVCAMLATMSQDPFAEDAVAALDSAQQQLAAAARTTLEERLRDVAQKCVDEDSHRPLPLLK